jgi:VanZ family protein
VTRLARAAAFLIGALVFWLSLTPQPPGPAGLPAYADIVAHVIMHGAFATTLAIGWSSAVARPAAVVAAVFLEVGQAQVTGRTFSLLDMAANGLGATAGLLAGAWFVARLNLAR